MRAWAINILKSIGYHFNDRDNGHTFDFDQRGGCQDSYRFIRERMSKAVLFSDTMQLRRFVIDLVCRGDLREKLLLEFGVFKGGTLNLFADRLKAANAREPIYGFDSFEGLEEDWSHVNFPSRRFDRAGKLPKTRANTRIVKGWVQDTLGGFLLEHPGKMIAFMHMDMDTYSPTKFVLEKTRDRCGSGAVILFDELYGYPNWRAHEHRALTEVYDENEYEYLAFGKLQCAIRIK
jgi:Methyltransferase domain